MTIVRLHIAADEAAVYLCFVVSRLYMVLINISKQKRVSWISVNRSIVLW